VIGLIKKGEGPNLEFKGKISKEIAKTICSFSNTEGGRIVIGVSDRGEVIGLIKKDLEMIESIIQAVSPKPKIKIEKIRIDDRWVVVLSVEPTGKLHTFRNIAYVRVGTSDIPLSIEEITEKLFELTIARFDELPSGAPVNELDMETFHSYLRKREEIRKIKTEIEDKEKLLRLLKITTNGELTNAGLLFFGKNPQKYCPHAKLRIIVYAGEDRSSVKEDLFISGNLWNQALQSIQEIKKRLPKGFIVEELERREEYPISIRVLREAILNAIIHRNYYIPSEILVEIFPSKIRIINPGGFPPGVTPENPIHKPRNPLISRYFFDVGLVEKYGVGIEMMKRICKEKGFPPPKYEEIRNFTILTLEFLPVYLRKYKLKNIDRKVYLSILDRAKSSSEIAIEVGKSKYAVLRALKRLEKLGLVKKIGRGKATRYVAK